MKRTDVLIEKAKEVIGGHYWCEDCYYSCPHHTEELGLLKEGEIPKPCNCNYNERLTALVLLLESVYGMGLSKGFVIGTKR